jgi:chemotaxis protein MotB
MSDSNNPFSDTKAKPGGTSGSTFTGWIVAGIIFILLIVVSCLWVSARNRSSEMDELNSKLVDARKQAETLAYENQSVKNQTEALQKQIAALEQEKEMVARKARDLESEMRADLESKDVTISKLQGKLTVNILDRVMFDSGEAILKPDGESVLLKVASILALHPELKIHVIGHTDNLPIHNRYTSNWELSTTRALAAVHFLTEKAGVNPIRVGAVGYGEFRPISDNSTAEGRSRNRRIAITILSDELAGADAQSPTKSGTPVEAQPVMPESSTR